MSEQDFINSCLESDCEHEWEIKDQINECVLLCECSICGENKQFNA